MRHQPPRATDGHHRRARLLTTVVAVSLLAACGGARPDLVQVAAPAGAAVAATQATPSAGPTPTAAPIATTAPTATPEPTTTTAPTATAEPTPEDTAFAPYAIAEDVVLVHPARTVRIIGFHESGHDGARQQEPVADLSRWETMETRGRGTGGRTAADVVVAPDTEIRSPVTGTVSSSGTYVLYCEHSDDFVFVEPDARPGWQVKIFHIDGVRVRAGDRVEAGITVLAPRATVLPFVSQVDELSPEPPWPHVHVEVVDPSIPDRPSPSGGC